MYEKYKKFLKKYISFNSIEWIILKSKLKIVNYKQGEIIHYAGDVCTNMIFITQGLARAYFIDEKGKDYTWSIYFNDSNSQISNLFMMDYESFVNQSESKFSIEILEDCEVIVSSYENVQFLYNNFKKSERFGRLTAQEAYSALHNYVITRQTKTATQRFDEFMSKTPYLLDKVPQYHIATFLGMTPQHLSRLKKQYKINNCE